VHLAYFQRIKLREITLTELSAYLRVKHLIGHGTDMLMFNIHKMFNVRYVDSFIQTSESLR
jgi:hypothetical protein